VSFTDFGMDGDK
jgi:hypothetical protein